MQLQKYSEEKQKDLVRYYNYYYGKGIRTLADFENFDKLIETNLDDLLKLMVLESCTDFKSRFESFPSNYSIFNMIYMLDQGQKNDPDLKVPTVDDFLQLSREYFDSCVFKLSIEEIVSMVLEDFERTIQNKNEEKETAEINKIPIRRTLEKRNGIKNRRPGKGHRRH